MLYELDFSQILDIGESYNVNLFLRGEGQYYDQHNLDRTKIYLSNITHGTSTH